MLLSLCKQESGSNEKSLTVLSLKPMAKNLDISRPSGIGPIFMLRTSKFSGRFSFSDSCI